MPPVQHPLPEHLRTYDEVAPDREGVARAVAALPSEEYERLLTEVLLTAHRCNVTRDYAPLRHLVDSVFATSWLHGSQEYRDARAAALRSEMTNVVDGDDFLEQIKGKIFSHP